MTHMVKVVNKNIIDGLSLMELIINDSYVHYHKELVNFQGLCDMSLAYTIHIVWE